MTQTTTNKYLSAAKLMELEIIKIHGSRVRTFFLIYNQIQISLLVKNNLSGYSFGFAAYVTRRGGTSPPEI